MPADIFDGDSNRVRSCLYDALVHGQEEIACFLSNLDVSDSFAMMKQVFDTLCARKQLSGVASAVKLFGRDLLTRLTFCDMDERDVK